MACSPAARTVVSMPSHTTIPASPEAAAEGLSDRRLQTPVRDFMRPGVIAVSEDASLRQAERAMVRHGVHAILVLGRTTGRPVGWVTSRGMMQWIGHDLGLVPASQGVTEAPTFIEPGATAQEAVKALSGTDVSHLLVTRMPGETPQGVVSDLDVIALCTRERR
jgi:CBS domain-containing protein